MADSDDGFALGELAVQGPVLIDQQHVYVRLGEPPAWQRVIDLASLEALDAGGNSSAPADTRGRFEAFRWETEQAVTTLLPGTHGPHVPHIVDFVAQAESHRSGRLVAVGSAQGVPGDTAPQSKLAFALGGMRPLLVHGGIVFVPARGIPAPITALPTQDTGFLPFFVPGAAVTLENLRERYRNPPVPPAADESHDEAAVEALGLVVPAIKRALSSRQRMLDQEVIYKCEETGLSTLVSQTGAVTFCAASDPWVVEDGDTGRYYRFDAFVLGTQPVRGPGGVRMVSPPAIIDPPRFQHWRPEFMQGQSTVLICTYQPRRPGSLPLHVTNCVDMLLDTRHMLRAGRFGPRAAPAAFGESFPQRRISREEADRLGLPIYPFCRTNLVAA